MKTTKLIPALALLVSLFSPLLFSPLVAQTVTYDFNNNPASVGAATPSVVATGFASSISLAGYTDKTADATNYIQWQTHPVSLNTGRYFQVSITNATESFTLTNFTFTPMRFRAAEYAKIEVRFSTKSGADFNTDYVTVWSSDGYQKTNGTPVSISLTSTDLQAKVKDISAGYFRIYTYDPQKSAGGAADGIWLGVDNINITATTGAVPEPATTAVILGLVAITGVVAFRRLRARQ
ncbi:hypothetical protein [Geminisphaera colitermitum]|uniref:hypothetical protein n=1 Tax=Geminisphaera colitermitum TaxID=1148786 RepID=UPI0001964D32|nr:hypothetical protein [Geminisphaera colitermitum]